MEIKKLILFTNNIAKQKKFYSEILELEEIKSHPDYEISFRVGNSILKFIQSNESTPYHFAINIYSNQEQEALLWLKERVSILTDGKTEIQNFKSWNAKAIYFYDEDKNIVEFIARKNLNQISRKAFNSKTFLEISEIGIPTKSIEKIYKKLNQEIGLSIYSGDFDEFCAIGDEKGLIICVDQIKKRWFPVHDKVFPSDFYIKILYRNKNFDIKFKDGVLLVS